ncbi:MAG TPA: hypothetical protein DCM28_08240 [Phycisphaerales bacterium]|nr:hypothetical protein [Phycisphaerales bacterium]HCD31984.1 hypothetical protein [Phycisphaerales bacterium]|tara:strand:- start:22972 stop:23682 length:711 start_codon:yes stop_codon:yes gene_type:complete
MPEIWTLSGINNQARANGPYVDYVGQSLLKGIPSLKPRHIARRYASRLGCKSHYPDSCNVLCLTPDRLLNSEAQKIAIGDHEVMPGIKAGEIKDRKVHVMLLAPKTNKYPKTRPTTLEIYWGSYDAVPNQGIFSPDSLTFWRSWSNKVYPISATHGIDDYLVAKPKIVKRVKKRRPNHKPTGPRYRYAWVSTGQTAPSVLQTLERWFNDLPSDDLVLVGHSQGTNIAMHLLARGMG